MIPLQTQEQFEGLLKSQKADGKPSDKAVVVYFTAAWCGACKRLQLDYLQSLYKGVVWYKCDIDENKYTLGYCGLNKIPSFAFIKNGKFLGKVTSSDTETVSDLIEDAFT